MNVRTLCLGILSFGEATGYEIKKLSQEGPFSYFVDVSFGSIYPSLDRMTAEGLVECREEQQSGRPDRKVYSITKAGRAALKDALRQDPAPDKLKSEFLFKMVFAAMLEPETVDGLVSRRLRAHEGEIEKLKHAREKCTRADNRFVIGFGLAVHEAARDYLAAHGQEAVEAARKTAKETEAAG